MDSYSFELKAGQLNQTFDAVRNCRAVKPPYEENGFFSADFFLDKRLAIRSGSVSPEGSSTTAGLTGSDFDFVDKIDVSGRRYFYYTKIPAKGGTVRYGAFATFDSSINQWRPVTVGGTELTFELDADSPLNVALGIGISGKKANTAPIQVATTFEKTGDAQAPFDYNKSPFFGGYLRLSYAWTESAVAQTVQVGDYVVWNDQRSSLSGGISRVQHVDVDGSTTRLYITETNTRGTLPIVTESGSTQGIYFDVYRANETTKVADINETAVVAHVRDESGTKFGALTLVIFNHDPSDFSEADTVLINKSRMERFIDIANYDGSIWALTKNNLYYSRNTYNDNTQFHPEDRFEMIAPRALFPVGKAMIAFAKQNSVISPIKTTKPTQYWKYGLKYYGEPFSKRSFAFVDDTIYVVQKDQRLVSIDISEYSSDTFNVVLKDVLINTKGLFNSVRSGAITVVDDGLDIHFLHVDGDDTVDYRFNKSYQHWIINDYAGIRINYVTRPIVNGDHYSWYQTYGKFDWLCKGFVGYEGYQSQESDTIGKDASGNDPVQSVTFGIIGASYGPNFILLSRTGFAKLKTNTDLDFTVSNELGGKTKVSKFLVADLPGDLDKLETVTADELIGYETPKEILEYDGTFFSFQANVQVTGRYSKFKFSSVNRFCIGNTYVMADKMKPFINEIDFTA